ncbi:MAG: NAD(P)H-dependent oxidoreductase [Sphingomonas sp.]|jgi:NAD(P)H-dependent FMN reductase|uniref:NADPH-dependent FMN reductase n=1 Tax=Sphingomonas sp. TaxID=28214 RepID=UPI0035687AFA
MTGLTIPILDGSVRHDRAGIRAAHWVMAALTARGHAPVLIDAAALGLPLLDRMYKEYAPGTAPAPLDELAVLFARADGFLVVSGEYNHAAPAALKNLLDTFQEEYFWRPSGIVCYSAGQFGGVRAAMQLRMTLAELGMSSIPSLMPIPRIVDAIDESGCARTAGLDSSLSRFLDEFLWYARALSHERGVGVPR